jgi:NAD(P)H dehydrogenase (quinone)
MARLLIIYYSQTGNTASMAELIAEGARYVSGVEVEVKSVAEAYVDDLLEADGVVLGSPVYYGGPAAQIKEFIDQSIVHHGKLAGKVAGAFASSGGPGGGNETTIMDLLKALLIHGMVCQGDFRGDHYGPIAVGAPDQRSAEECRRWGQALAELTARLAPQD